MDPNEQSVWLNNIEKDVFNSTKKHPVNAINSKKIQKKNVCDKYSEMNVSAESTAGYFYY